MVALEAAGQLHRRHRFVYAAAPDLRVGLTNDPPMLCFSGTRAQAAPSCLGLIHLEACSCPARMMPFMLLLLQCHKQGRPLCSDMGGPWL